MQCLALRMGEFPSPPPPAVLYRNAVPFKHFATLVHELGSIRARPADSGKAPTGSRTRSPAPDALRAFIDTGRQALSTAADGADGLVVLFFRLFFPDEGVRRRSVNHLLGAARKVAMLDPGQEV